MDVRRIKLRLPYAVPIPGAAQGASIKLLPLTDAEVEAAEVAASDVPLSGFSLRLQVVAASLGVSPAALAQRIAPHQLAWLYRQWQEAQRAAWPPVSPLIEWLRKSVNDHPDVIADGAAATQAKDLEAYYGRAAMDCTRGQLVWFMSLRDAYREFRVDGKKPTGDWLKKDREERLRWQMNDR